MDLKEISDSKTRHPWEIVKVKTLTNVLKKVFVNCRNIKILDVGCGDAFMVSELIKYFHFESYDGVDIYLTDNQINSYSNVLNNIRLHLNYKSLENNVYNLILFMDVIEHIDHDYDFLFHIVKKYAADDAFILFTCPAFEFLYCSHDSFLGHFRRYNKRKLVALIERLELECLSLGYMFFCLLPVRFLQCFYEKLIAPKALSTKGTGQWKQGVFLSRIIELILHGDNKILLMFNKIGVNLPGLTVWALCKRLQS